MNLSVVPSPRMNGTASLSDGPLTRTQEPVCTGASILGIQFDGGVAIAADTLASYGKMARFKNVTRLLKVNKRTLVGVFGDYADFQELKTLIECKQTELQIKDADATLSPLALHSWLTAVLYNRRSKFDPYWNTFIVGGLVGENSEPIDVPTDSDDFYVRFCPWVLQAVKNRLSQKDEAEMEAALNRARKDNKALTKEAAVELLEKLMETLWLRDCTAHNEFEIGIVTAAGCEIIQGKRITGNWEMAADVRGYE